MNLFARRLLTILVLTLAAPLTASAVTHEVSIYLDLDNDSGTGCEVTTVDGPFAGAEQVLITTVETSSPPEMAQVTDVAIADCVDEVTDTFGAPVSFDGNWPVGIGNGIGGRDVVETYVPLVQLVVADPAIVRLGLVVTDEQGGEEALLTVDGTREGAPIVLELLSVLEIPTLGEWGLVLLVLLLLAAAFAVLGRRRSAALVLALFLLAAGGAWAAESLDGLTDDWSAADLLASSDLVLFGKQVGSDLCFRVDLDLLFNSGPEAVDDAYATDEDSPISPAAPGLLGNDSDPDSDPLTVSDHDPTSTQGAVVNVNADGSFSYGPTGAAALQALDDGESVDDTFGYTASDGTATDTATATVSVDGVNDAPTAMADMYETAEDTALVISVPGVLVNDDDVDGETITAVLDTDVSNGTLTLNADGSFTYTPDLDFNGADSFTYHASDGDADSPTVTATITVGPVNDGPNAVDDLFMTDEDTVLNETAPGVLTNDTDPEMDALTVTTADTVSAQGATVTVNADGSLSYDPTGVATLQALDDGEMLNDTFTYTIDDGSGNPDTATVTVTVEGANDAPVAVDDGYTTAEDVTLNAPATGVLGNDTDVDVEGLTAVLVSGPSNADSFTLNPDGSFSYTPALNFNGSDSFTYRADDGTVDSNLATVTITIDPVNDPPVADDEVISATCNIQGVVETAPGQTAAGSDPVFRTVADNVLVGDSDPVEMSAVTIVAASGLPGGTTDSTGPDFTITTDQGGSLTLHADGSFVYTPEGGDRSVADSFTYTIQDAEGAQDTATVTLNVGSTCVWFVDNSAGADDTGTGTSSDPFTSLVDEIGPDNDPDDAEDASIAGDVIYVFEGDSQSGDPYDGNFNAEANQRILGQGVDLVVDFGSGPETLFTGNPANRPQVVGVSAGVGVSVIDVGGVEVAGLELTGGDHSFTANAITAAIGVDFHDNVTSGSSNQAIVIDQPGAFTSTVALTDNQIESSTGSGIQVEVSAGSLELAIDGNTGLTSSSTAIDLDGGGGSLYVTSFCGNSISGDTSGTGIQMLDVIFDANPADLDFTGDEVTCGTGTTIGSSVNPVDGFGLLFDGVTGDLDLGQLDVHVGVAGGGDETAVEIAGSGSFDAAAGTGFQLTTSGGTVSSIDGPAIVIDPTTLETMVLTSVVSQNSDTVGIALEEVFGSLQVTGVTTIGSAGTDGIAVTDTMADLTFTGALTISGTGGEGIALDAMSGDLVVLDPTSSITGTTGDAFFSTGGLGAIDFNGSITNASGNSVELRLHGGGTLVDFDGFITDTGAGIELFNNDQVGGSTINFDGGLDLDTGTSTAFNATEGGTVNVTSGSVSTTADTTTGTVVNFINTVIGGSGVTFDSTSSTGGADGINLTNVGSGAFTTLGGSLSNQTDRGVDVAGGNGDIRIDSLISTTATGRSVEVTTHTGGTVDFNGAIDDNGFGIRLASNVGSVLRFDGGMDVDTSAGSGTEEGFEATGGGTLHVTGTNDVDTSLATGIAVNVSGGTTIGADDVTFRNVSADGAANGILLAGTGTAGDFMVTGDGSQTRNDSGGVVLNTTSHGVSLTDAHGVTLQSMRVDTLNTALTHGISSSGGSDVVLSGLTVQNLNGTDSNGWLARDLGGINAIEGSLFTAFDPDAEGGVDVINVNTNMTSFTIDDTDFTNQDSSNGKTVVFIEGQGTSNMGTVTVQGGSLFSGLAGNALQTSAVNTATMTTVIDGNVFRDANPAGLGGIGGVASTASGSAGHTITISNNQFDDVQIASGNAGTLAVAAFNTSSMTATISGNQFTDLDSDGDVVADAQAIRVVSEQTGGGAVDVTVSGNTIDDVGRQAIFVSTRNQAPDVDVRITGNSIGQTTPVGGTNRDAIVASAEDDSNLDVLITGNTVTANVSSQEVMELFTDRVSAGNTPVLNATVGGAGPLANTFTNSNGAGADNVVVLTEDVGETICLNMTNNTLAGVNTIDLDNSAGGTFNVTQTSEAAMETANNGANVVPVGGVSFNQPACPTPTF